MGKLVWDFLVRDIAQKQSQGSSNAVSILAHAIFRQRAREGEHGGTVGVDAHAVAMIQADRRAHILRICSSISQVRHRIARGQWIRSGLSHGIQWTAVNPLGNHQHQGTAINHRVNFGHARSIQRSQQISATQDLRLGLRAGGIAPGAGGGFVAALVSTQYGGIHDGQSPYLACREVSGLPQPGRRRAAVIGEEAVLTAEDRGTRNQTRTTDPPGGQRRKDRGHRVGGRSHHNRLGRLR